VRWALVFIWVSSSPGAYAPRGNYGALNVQPVEVFSTAAACAAEQNFFTRQHIRDGIVFSQCVRVGS
jgi:hypothetical protein